MLPREFVESLSLQLLKYDWTQYWALCSSWPCSEYDDGLGNLQWFFPTSVFLFSNMFIIPDRFLIGAMLPCITSCSFFGRERKNFSIFWFCFQDNVQATGIVRHEWALVFSSAFFSALLLLLSKETYEASQLPSEPGFCLTSWRKRWS